MRGLPATLLLLLLPLHAPGADEPGTITLLLENDAFAATDHHYTHGLEITWLGAPEPADAVATRIAEWLPGNRNGQARAGWQFGQSIFTPVDKHARRLLTGERPYAAWLYGGLSLVYNAPAHIDTLSLMLGTVGPNAQGEGLQRAVHEWLGTNESRGWNNQVGNRAGGMLIIERKWRVLAGDAGSLRADFLPHAGVALGNVATYANAGFTIRLGDDLDNDFGPPHIRPSLPGSGYFVADDEWTWYLFAGVDGRIVERNIFVDDNELETLLDIRKERRVADVQAGLVLARGDFRAAYTFVHRSREFDRQRAADRFGSLAFTWRF